jgi:hypothetical protein
MKLKIAAFAALLVAGAAAPAFATQGSQSVNASAAVITPITTSATAMNLGSLVMDASNTAGTLVLSPLGARSVTGGVNLVGGATGTAGSVSVTAQSGNTYSVTLPTSVSLTSGANSMTLDTFTSSIAQLSGVTGNGSAQTYPIGATLHAGASQAAGTYTGSFTVTAAYD